jgi:alpha-beta hydrolase superfamily lysophospholipase
MIKNVDGIPPETTSYRVLYHSTALDGRDMAVSGMILVPGQAPPPGGYPIVSWAHGTTGAADLCAPSILESNSMPFLSQFLSDGFVVAETDYAGLGTPGIQPYLVGLSEARSVLDAARAARHLVGPQASNKVVLFGHSQGGHAVIFAGQEAKSYSPELHVVGLVSVAPVGSLTDLVPATPPPTSVAGQPYAVLAAIVWSEIYPDIQLSKVLTPAGEALRPLVDERCIGDLVTATAGSSASQLFQPHWSQAPGMASAIARNTPGGAPTSVPVLLIQGYQDEIVTTSSTSAVDKRLCAQGDAVQYDLYLHHNHGSVAQETEASILGWIRDLRAGGTPPSNCGNAPTTY